MKVCDICQNPSMYTSYAVIDPDGAGKNLDLCGRCYMALEKKEKEHRYLAYKEIMDEHSQISIHQTWLDILRSKIKR